MKQDNHERALGLIDKMQVEGLTAEEHSELEAHLESCPTCQKRARDTDRALGALHSAVPRFEATLVQTTQLRTRIRARELLDNAARMRALWISCALSWILGAASAPFLWRGYQWVGHHASLPNVIWEAGFVLWWLLPPGAVAAFVAWQRQRAGSVDDYTNLPR